MSKKPLYVVAGQSNAGWMTEFGSMEKYIKANDIDATVVSSYMGGTTFAKQLARPDWYPYEDGNDLTGELYRKLFQDIQAALDADPDLYLAGFLWVHGENDSKTEWRVKPYAEYLEKMYTDLQESFGSEFTFTLTQLSKNLEKHKDRDLADEMSKKQAEFANKFEGVTIIDPDIAINDEKIRVPDASFDWVHYSEKAGDALAKAFLDQFHKETPDSVGEKIIYREENSQSTVFNADGDKIALHRVLDDGRSIIKKFSEGQSIFVQVYDVDDAFSWESRATIYDLNGRVLKTQSVRDNGAELERVFQRNIDRAELNDEIQDLLNEDWFLL